MMCVLIRGRASQWALVLLAVLGSATAAWASSASHGGELPDVNWWAWSKHAPPVGWYLVDFVLFVVGLVYLARRPIREAFAERHLSVKRSIEEAARAHAEVSERYEMYKDKLANIDDESALLVRRAKEDGTAEMEQIVTGAKAYAERLRADLASISDQELAMARQRLRHEAVELLLANVEASLRKETGAAEHKTLIDQAIAQLTDGLDGDAPAKRRGEKVRPAAGETP